MTRRELGHRADTFAALLANSLGELVQRRRPQSAVKATAAAQAAVKHLYEEQRS